jgi:O-antigen ligase
MFRLNNLIWLTHIAFIVRVTVFVRRRSAFADIDPFAFIQILIVYLNCFLSLISGKLFVVIGDVLRSSLLFLFLYYVLCMLSSIWSSLPQFTLYKSFEYAALLLSVLIAISFEKNYESAEKKVLALVTITLFCGIFLHIKNSNYHISISSLHTNQYSATAAMLSAYCLGEYFKAHNPRKKTLRRFGVVGLLFLVIGTSAASNMAFLCGAVLVFVLVGRLFLAFAGACILAISYLIGVYVFETDFGFLPYVLAPGKTAKDLETGSGRLMIIEYYKRRIFQSPFLGHGFAVMETKKGFLRPGLTHNSILSVLLGTGLLGMFFYGIFLIKLGIQSVKSLAAKRQGCIGATAAIVAGLINSLSIALVADYWMEPSFSFCCFLGLSTWHILARDRKKKRYVPSNFTMNNSSAKI